MSGWPAARVTALEVVALNASWERIFGGPEAVPAALRHPAAHFAVIPRRGQCSTLVLARTETGLVGLGESWGLPDAEITARIVREQLAPLIVGQPLARWPEIWAAWTAYCRRLGYGEGPMIEALAGVDLALWDLRAQLEGTTVSGLLGGARRSRLTSYCSPVPFFDEPAQSAAEARRLVALGHRALKIKSGRSLAVDVAHAQAVRDAVGPEVGLLVDVNGGCDLPAARALAEALSPLDLIWLEEPLPPDALAEQRELRAGMTMPLAAGENAFSAAAFRRLIEEARVDVIMPNLSRVGGLTGLREIAAVAAANGAKLSLQGVGGAVALHAALHYAAADPAVISLEANLLPNPLRDSLTDPPLRHDAGEWVLPEEGADPIRLHEATVAKFAVGSLDRKVFSARWSGRSAGAGGGDRPENAPPPSAPGTARFAFDAVVPRRVRLPYLFEDVSDRRGCVVFLHGAGEKGDDLALLEKACLFAGRHEARRHGLALACPQCPPGPGWNITDLAAWLDHVIAEHALDPARIVLTGISMGGRGTWDFAYAHADRLAGIAPVCGPSLPTLAPRLADLPVWCFHGVEDDVVPVTISDWTMAALASGNAERRYARMEGVGHGCGDEVYARPELWAWFAGLV